MDVLDLMQTTAELNWFQFGHNFVVVDVIAVVFTIVENLDMERIHSIE